MYPFDWPLNQSAAHLFAGRNVSEFVGRLRLLLGTQNPQTQNPEEKNMENNQTRVSSSARNIFVDSGAVS